MSTHVFIRAASHRVTRPRRAPRSVRGQSGPEFIILFGFLMLVFLVFLIALNNRYVEQRRLNQELLYASIADRFAMEVSIAAQVEAGYRRQFTLPLTLKGEHYNITLGSDDSIVVSGVRAENDYVRFLDTPITLVGGPPNTVFPDDNPTVIIEKHPVFGVRIRKDCVANGVPVEDCV